MNRLPSKYVRNFRNFALNGALAAVTTFVLTAVRQAQANPGQDNRAPDVPAALEVPAGNKVAFHAFAAGVQIYEWSGSAWVFVAPEAVLFADAGGHGEVGIHYAGPTWESESGSKVVGARVASSPAAGAIPAPACGAAACAAHARSGAAAGLSQLPGIFRPVPSLIIDR